MIIIIYVRKIFGPATKETSHPSMMETCRAMTSAVPPTADIVACLKSAVSGHSAPHTNDRNGARATRYRFRVPSQHSRWFVQLNPAVPAGRKKECNTARHVRVDFCIQRLEVHLEQRPEQHGHGDDIPHHRTLSGPSACRKCAKADVPHFHNADPSRRSRRSPRRRHRWATTRRAR